MKKILILMPKILSGAFTIFILMIHTSSYADDFKLLCSPPLFSDWLVDNRICVQIGQSFQAGYGSEYNIQVKVNIEPERDAVRAIITSSIADAGGFDVWIGGREYYHELALKKDLTVRKEQVFISVHGRSRSIYLSFPRNGSRSKIPYIFLDWLKSANFDE